MKTMTLKEFLNKKPIQVQVDKINTWSAVNVCFINPAGVEDETQFDIKHIGTKSGNEELINLFTEFCKENKFKTNTVYNVVVIASARTYEKLETLC